MSGKDASSSRGSRHELQHSMGSLSQGSEPILFFPYFLMKVRKFFENGSPLAFIPQTPFCGREISRGKAENPFFPEKLFFRFVESVLKPRHTARILGGQNPKKKTALSILEKIHPPRKSKEQGTFFLFGVAE